MKRQSIHYIVLFLCSNYTVRYQIIASKENSPYHQKNFCFFLKPNSFLIDRISCQGTKNLASTRKKTKFPVVISLRMQVFPITTIRFKNPAKISRFVYSTHSPFNACADKCPLCLQLYHHGWNWKNEKLCGNTTPAGRRVFTKFQVFPISTSVDITVHQHGKNVLYFFYDIAKKIQNYCN